MVIVTLDQNDSTLTGLQGRDDVTHLHAELFLVNIYILT